MLEPAPGIFIGNISARVRDRLWQQAIRETGEGGAVLVHRAQTEQGFAIRTHGEPRRQIVNLDGLNLVRIPPQQRE